MGNGARAWKLFTGTPSIHGQRYGRRQDDSHTATRLGARRALLIAGCFLFLLPQSSSREARNEFQQRVGIYVWGQLPVADEPLVRASQDIKCLGAKTAIRIAMTPYWDPFPNADAGTPLDLKLYRHDYWVVLNSFPVVMITAYDAASYPWQYRNCPSEQACEPLFSAVRQEFYTFTLELSKIQGTFIISNWEAENDFPDEGRWDVYRAYLQARIDGIIAGRAEAKKLKYKGNVYSAFEFLVINGFVGKRSGLVEIGTKLRGVDFLSYSAWHSIAYDRGSEAMEKDFEYAASIIRQFAREKGISDRLIIGEFGELWDMHPDPVRMKSLIKGSLAGGVEYLFNWVAYDQPGETDEYQRDASHFGKFYLKGGLTPQGRGFAQIFASSSLNTSWKSQRMAPHNCVNSQ